MAAEYDIWVEGTKVDDIDWRTTEDGLSDDNDDEAATSATPDAIKFLGFDPFDDGDDDGDEETANAIFDKAKQRYRELDLKAQKAASALRAVAGEEKGPMGLTPEHIRMSPQYKGAKKDYDRAAAELKTFAAGYVKQFDKEIKAERQDPDYMRKRQAEIKAMKAQQEKSFVPMMATPAEIANAGLRALKRAPVKATPMQRSARRMQSVQKPVNVRVRDTALNRTRPGMKFLHRTETADGKPAEMKVFAVKGGSIYYDEPNARKPGFYCDPSYFYSKVFKEWVK